MTSPVPEIFTEQLTVTTAHLDAIGHVNNVVYLQWILDIAEAHWRSKFLDHDVSTGYWVVLEHLISYKKQAFLNDKVTLKTFVEPPNGLRFPRNVHIMKGDELLVTGKTQWCWIDGQTNRPRQVSEEILRGFGIQS